MSYTPKISRRAALASAAALPLVAATAGASRAAHALTGSLSDNDRSPLYDEDPVDDGIRLFVVGLPQLEAPLRGADGVEWWGGGGRRGRQRPWRRPGKGGRKRRLRCSNSR